MCTVATHSPRGDRESKRFLKEDGCDIYIRDEILISIMNKAKSLRERMFDSMVSARKPYGLEAETMLSSKKFGLPEFSNEKIPGGYEIFGLGDKMKRMWKYIPNDYPIPKKSPCFNKYKVFIAEAYGCGAFGEAPSTPVIGLPNQLCTETFLEIGPFETKVEAFNVTQYIKTKFFRALVGIQKQTQHTTQKAYRFVPMQNFTEKSDIGWSKSIGSIDKQLFKKYNFSTEEIEFIEKNIQEIK